MVQNEASMIPRRLIVSWKREDSRPIVPVGELVVEQDARGTRYEFHYLEGVREALALGFPPFMAFPDLRRRYASDQLFEFFRNRVLPKTRPDYVETVTALGLDPKQASFADLLGRSNGRRATDRIETVLVPERDATGAYVTHFLVRGVRHRVDVEPVIATLKPGDPLGCALEATNEYNPRVRRLLAGDTHLGYLPDYLVADVDALETCGVQPVVTVERVNPPPQPRHHRLLCRLQAPWPDGFDPLRDPRLAPYQEGSPPLARQAS